MFEKLIEKRFSARNYKDEKLSKEVIDKILNAGRLAPTACNFQSERIFVLESSEALKKIKNAGANIYNAPCCLLICGDDKTCWHSEKENFSSYEMDATIAMSYMSLMASTLGVGNCIIRAFDSQKIKNEFNLSENIKPVILLALGYTDEKEKIKNRKNIDEIVTYL